MNLANLTEHEITLIRTALNFRAAHLEKLEADDFHFSNSSRDYRELAAKLRELADTA